MKRVLILIAFLCMSALLVSGQVPQKFNYQAVVRDTREGLVTNQEVGFKLSILEGSASGSPVYVETHAVTTTGLGLANLVIGDGDVVSGTFGTIPWGSNDYFLKVEMDPAGGSTYEHLGTSQLISVPYALYSGSISSPTRKFTIQENPGHPADSALFEVRNLEGQTVFAVYPEGTRVYVLDEEAKGKKGGFSVGGYSRATKGVTQEYMRVTPDSIRMYVDEGATKGKKGGFAVGGYSRSKGPTDHYFTLKPDSANFLMVSEQPEEANSSALTVSTKSGSGDGGSTRYRLFNLTRDNYFIGHRAGSSNTTGYQNCFLGFESGKNNTTGKGNIFIGQQSGLDNVDGYDNVFIGEEAGKNNTTGDLNTIVGFQAGLNTTTGRYNSIYGFWAGYENQGGDLNTYFGAHAGHLVRNGEFNTYVGAYSGSEKNTGTHNTFVGMRAGSYVGSGLNTIVGSHAGTVDNGGLNVFVGTFAGGNNTGTRNTFIGSDAGSMSTSGSNNVFLGSRSGVHLEGGDDNVLIGTGAGEWTESGAKNVLIGYEAGAHCQGNNNVFIGNKAGIDIQGSHTLVIDNDQSDSVNSLIWGKFDQEMLRFNNKVGIGMEPGDSVSLAVNGDAYKSSGTTTWDVTSDARVKTDIRTIENGLEQIMRLRPVTFRYTDEWRMANPGVKNKEYYHFVAQEFAGVFPGSVHRGPEKLEGDPEQLLRMNSQPAQVVAIRAIQELAEQNMEQQAVLERLQQENRELRRLLEDLIANQ